MQEKNKLTLYMGLLYLIVILSFGLIIITEKKKDYLIPKVEEKIMIYLEKEYKEEQEFFEYGKVSITDHSYQMKVYHKENKNLYFIVTYQNKKITDTYKTDYLEGKTLNSYLSKIYNQKIDNLQNEKYKTYKISYNTKLNDCTEEIKERLIKEDDTVPIYTINIEESLKENLQETLEDILKDTESLNLNPKNYKITLNNPKNISKSVHLEVDHDIIKIHLEEIVTAIENKDSSTLNKYNIKWKYLN